MVQTMFKNKIKLGKRGSHPRPLGKIPYFFFLTLPYGASKARMALCDPAIFLKQLPEDLLRGSACFYIFYNMILSSCITDWT